MDAQEMERQVRGMTTEQRKAAWLVAARTTWAGSKPLADLIAKVAKENGEKLPNASSK